MAKRDNQVIAYLTDHEKIKLDRFLEDSPKTQSELIRRAIVEYLDQDRAARVESELDELHDKIDRLVGTLSDETSHTHMPQQAMQGSTALERAFDMVDRLQRNHNDVIKNDDVERVIEDYAGADNRTVEKYKRLFRKRGILFEHPGERPVWTVDSNTWCDWIVDYTQLNGLDDAEGVAEAYPATVARGVDGGVHIELSEVEA